MQEYSAKILTRRFEKIRGLIGEDRPYPVFFRTRFGIHTFGLRFPIDVLILDSQNIVVKAVSRLSPNRVLFWPLGYDGVLELPAGEIIRRKIKLGRRISLNF